MNNTELDLNHQKKKKKKNSLETEASLRDKLKRAEEKENAQDSYLWNIIFGAITFIGLAIFVYWKKVLDEYWMYAFWPLVGLAVIGLILIPFAYKWLKEAEKEVKELKKRLKDSV